MLSLVQPPLYRAKASLEIEALNYNFPAIKRYRSGEPRGSIAVSPSLLAGPSYWFDKSLQNLGATMPRYYPAMSPSELIACGNVPVAEGTSNVGKAPFLDRTKPWVPVSSTYQSAIVPARLTLTASVSVAPGTPKGYVAVLVSHQALELEKRLRGHIGPIPQFRLLAIVV
ncbi:MAG: hypothetical protein WB676_03360 [Bryobacteraceae bacterium]